MKYSTIFRAAAEMVGDYQKQWETLACCHAIHHSTPDDFDFGSSLYAKIRFANIFNPDRDKTGYWWGYASHLHTSRFNQQQNARVIALLLAAEIAEEEGD